MNIYTLLGPRRMFRGVTKGKSNLHINNFRNSSNSFQNQSNFMSLCICLLYAKAGILMYVHRNDLGIFICLCAHQAGIIFESLFDCLKVEPYCGILLQIWI